MSFKPYPRDDAASTHVVQVGSPANSERPRKAEGPIGPEPPLLTDDDAPPDHANVHELDVNSRDRPEIECVRGEAHRAVAAGVSALATDPEVYERGGKPVFITTTDNGERDEDRPELARPENRTLIQRAIDAPAIRGITPPWLWARLSKRAHFTRYDGRAKKPLPIDPPDNVVKAVLACTGQSSAFRQLAGIVGSPVLRPDGTLFSTPGYDPVTRLYYHPTGRVCPVPDLPTRDDALRASLVLLDVVSDFPFVGAADRSAFLSALLTPVAYGSYGHECGAPCHSFESATRGAGKGKLVELCGIIATGRPVALAPYVEDDNELRKRIFSICLQGDALAVIDNCPSGAEIGWPSLDAALTARLYSDRVLGKSESPTVPNNVCWYITGNNLGVKADIARRLLRIRLEPNTDRPEHRSGFRYSLPLWARQHRPELLAAALTVLRAYFVAGRPRAEHADLGSFEAWSRVVRDSIVWLGYADPVEALASSDVIADPTELPHIEWMRVMLQLDPRGDGFTAKEMLGKPQLHEALCEICPPKRGETLPDSHTIGRKLRVLKGRLRNLGDGQLAAFQHAATLGKSGAVRWVARVTTRTS